MSKKVVVASRNIGKLKEFSTLLTPLGLEMISLSEFTQVPDVVEDGETFMENAYKKAKEVAKALQLPAIADDSGLCVRALHGAPGVYSARYAGLHGADQANNDKVVKELADKGLAGLRPDDMARAASFVCALVYYDPQTKQTIKVEGKCEGTVLDAPRGTGGFGYDPLFYLPQHGKTMAELSMEEKNQISHRSKALLKLATAWQEQVVKAHAD